ncbi:30S ribosomal protein S8e [Candidatus Pacearchaeota archaeon]|nr:30S ribosomal protein S8e [Candidatus Pacearchaeota archaeon]
MKQGRKPTGGKYHQRRKKKLHEKQRQPTRTTIGEPRRKKTAGQGHTKKTRSLKENQVNLIKDKKTIKTEIKNVIETPQNRFFARSNLLARGSIIETAEGKARITNRPSQEGHVNAVLVKE